MRLFTERTARRENKKVSVGQERISCHPPYSTWQKHLLLPYGIHPA